jgi:hypothetical protein
MKFSRLPVQAMPVRRTITGMPMSNEKGVDASGLLSDIGQAFDDFSDVLIDKIKFW